jgi:hypothetical protein
MIKQILPIILILISLSACDHFSRTRNRTKTANGESKEVIVDENGDSIMVYYRKDGSIRSKAMFKNRYKNGPAYNYYEDGKVQNLIHYKDGFKHGLAIWYYKSGKKYRETNYFEGQKDGVQKFYYETGELKAEVPYKKGQLQLGTKEYTKSGKIIRDYPRIIVNPIDRLKEENRYYLQFSLDPPRKRVLYYMVKKVNGTEAKIGLDSFTKNGVARYPYVLYPGQSVMEKVEIRAEIKSRRKIPVIIRRTYNLAAENRNW